MPRMPRSLSTRVHLSNRAGCLSVPVVNISGDWVRSIVGRWRFSVLAKGQYATAIDTRLYLPKEWTDDPQRCDKAGIPESERVFKTKNELALEIVEQARRNGVRFGWVGAD